MSDERPKPPSGYQNWIEVSLRKNLPYPDRIHAVAELAALLQCARAAKDERHLATLQGSMLSATVKQKIAARLDAALARVEHLLRNERTPHDPNPD